MDWNDLRFVFAVGRAGSLSGAARALGVNHSTVFRRINIIEQQLGVRLFERFRDGYTPTPAGEEMCRLAAGLDAQINTLEQCLRGQDIHPGGVLRVTTTDTLMMLLTPLFAGFRAVYPAIELELVVSNEFFNLTRRQADIAIRPTREPPEALIGRRLCNIASAVYAAKHYLETSEIAPEQLADHLWIGPDDSLSQLPAGAWQKKIFPEARVGYRANTLLAMTEAVKSGLGIAALPCFLGDNSGGLRRIYGPVDELAGSLWLLTHPDLRRVARVRVFFDFMAEQIKQQKALLEGKAGGREG
jgi:DNA-binding transcriptional LysR family regulator